MTVCKNDGLQAADKVMYISTTSLTVIYYIPYNHC